MSRIGVCVTAHIERIERLTGSNSRTSGLVIGHGMYGIGEGVIVKDACDCFKSFCIFLLHFIATHCSGGGKDFLFYIKIISLHMKY